MGKLKKGLRIPAMIITIIALVFRLFHRGFSIADYGLGSLSNLLGHFLITSSVIIVLIYFFGVCNSRAGKIILGIAMTFYPLAFLIWDAELVIDGSFDLYLMVELIAASAVAIFAIWLFTNMRSKIMPIIAVSLFSLPYIHYIANRLSNVSMFSSYEYWHSEYYLIRTVTGWTFWTMFDAAIILLIIAEMTRSKVPAHAPAYDPMYAAPMQQVPMYNTPVQQAPMYNAPEQQAPMYNAPEQQAPVMEAPAQAPVQQKSETDVKLETLKRLFEAGTISEEDYKNELVKIASEK